MSLSQAGLGAVHQPVECMDTKMVLSRSFSFSTWKEAKMEAAARRGVEAVKLESPRVQRLKVGEQIMSGGEEDFYLCIKTSSQCGIMRPALSVELWFFYLFSTVPRPFQNISNTNLDNAV